MSLYDDVRDRRDDLLRVRVRVLTYLIFGYFKFIVALQLMFSAHAYEQALTSGEASEEDLSKMREEINQLSTDLKTENHT